MHTHRNNLLTGIFFLQALSKDLVSPSPMLWRNAYCMEKLYCNSRLIIKHISKSWTGRKYLYRCNGAISRELLLYLTEQWSMKGDAEKELKKKNAKKEHIWKCCVLARSWKNHWARYHLHYSERLRIVLQGLKLFYLIRARNSMPILTAIKCIWSRSVKQNKYRGPQSYAVCIRDPTAIMAATGRLIKSALTAACPSCWITPGAPLPDQFSKMEASLGTLRPFLSLKKNSLNGDKQNSFPNPFWSQQIHECAYSRKS